MKHQPVEGPHPNLAEMQPTATNSLGRINLEETGEGITIAQPDHVQTPSASIPHSESAQTLEEQLIKHTAELKIKTASLEASINERQLALARILHASNVTSEDDDLLEQGEQSRAYCGGEAESELRQAASVLPPPATRPIQGLGHLLDELQKAQDEIRKLKDENSRLKDENSELKDENSELEVENSGLEDDLASLQKDYAGLYRNVGILRQENAKLYQDVDILNQEIHRLNLEGDMLQQNATG
ncbi:hypothetical protein BU24DRAFT_475100 [Aaosphaeria arxii CBS 175.79]|uniref:Uncharacterized protein n=1 Tax=Aaosphaeria arxii CBS 175.79 TaxID=1450172 RepID=A0A6A5X6S9_9PLEO|nr:uncharacterized protein BU24DRAFT_475100 [Aaosphaeria arxii CBS 175.79]KAF2008639.1 hypothetical protein BU24DRAFT_475100 [Aaosphaeria arxii CBS 175.79]